MEKPPTAIERAFQLAQKGLVIGEVKRQLKAEGYEKVELTFAGRALARQLREEATRVKFIRCISERSRP